MSQPDRMVRVMAWVYTAGFCFVSIVTNVPFFNDAQGRSFGLFQIDPRDNIVHIASAIAGAAVSLSGRWLLPFFWAVTLLYGIDALVGLTTQQGLLDLSVFTATWAPPDVGVRNVLLNLPHIVIVAGSAYVLAAAPRPNANAVPVASV